MKNLSIAVLLMLTIFIFTSCNENPLTETDLLQQSSSVSNQKKNITDVTNTLNSIVKENMFSEKELDIYGNLHSSGVEHNIFAFR
ncbi:hypothetical protein Fleli_1093 [Bernardetia litoralis DSM 6794]|uniref:Uncharacterized protein n=2 Tax=Bernardetia litoralis TaxID=999 RepID=I4AHU6_BERLS|nr:hypothetical protein Fleli_1093 [Bernardetia litoralis DSM 6794]